MILLFLPIYGSTEEFLYMQLFGYIFTIIGVVIFNEVVIIHYWGFDKYTKAALKAKRASQHHKTISVRNIKGKSYLSTKLNDSIVSSNDDDIYDNEGANKDP
jgi:hypothetical protein